MPLLHTELFIDITQVRSSPHLRQGTLSGYVYGLSLCSCSFRLHCCFYQEYSGTAAAGASEGLPHQSIVISLTLISSAYNVSEYMQEIYSNLYVLLRPRLNSESQSDHTVTCGQACFQFRPLIIARLSRFKSEFQI